MRSPFLIFRIFLKKFPKIKGRNILYEALLIARKFLNNRIKILPYIKASPRGEAVAESD